MADEIIDTMINELIATLRSGLQLLPEDQRMNVVARVHRAVVDELQYRVDANNPEAQSLPPETQQWLQWDRAEAAMETASRPPLGDDWFKPYQPWAAGGRNLPPPLFPAYRGMIGSRAISAGDFASTIRPHASSGCLRLRPRDRHVLGSTSGMAMFPGSYPRECAKALALLASNQ